jgi:hypothetical protein
MDTHKPQISKERKEGTKERWALIKRMLDSGMTGHAIAHETGMSKGTVYWHIREMRARHERTPNSIFRSDGSRFA